MLRIFTVLLVSLSSFVLLIWEGRFITREADPPELSNPAKFVPLESVHVPAADFADLAERLGGRQRVDKAFPAPIQATFAPGSLERFWVTNMHGSRFQVETKLWLETAHSRMWVEANQEIDFQQLVELGLALEEQIYPIVNLLLGTETRSPDAIVEIIFTDKLGPKVAGYFSPLDMISSKIFETSNDRMMILINADLAKDQDRLFRLVAHELQHLVHWDHDSNESVWVQEGFSGYVEQLLGQDRDPRASAYLSEPDLQLNAWPLDGDFARHYGAASLLINYLDRRFGTQFVSALAQHDDNGLEGLDSLINHLDLWDSTRNKLLATEDIVMDWGLANYLQLSLGPYSYAGSTNMLRTPAFEFAGHCKDVSSDHMVSQYGFDYFRVQCDEDRVLSFSGAPTTNLLPTTAHSGQYFVWSNRGDQIDTRLTRQFDFTDVAGPLTLQFWTWYELQRGSDFVYLLASEDEQHWSFLETTSGDAPGDIAGAQLGFGYSGINRRLEWSRQTVDLSQFAGNRVTLRFEYVTDSARTGEGFPTQRGRVRVF